MSAKQFSVIHGRLASAVGDTSTFTVGYPTGTNLGTFIGGLDHRLVINQKEYSAPDKFGLALTSASVMTVTNRSGASWPVDSEFYLQVEVPGTPFVDPIRGTEPHRTTALYPVRINLGCPIALDADGFAATTDLTAAGVFSVGTTAAGAIAAAALAGVNDVPRAIVAAWTGTAVLTVTGTDEYGEVLTEASASGTSLTGKKAFKTVTGISTSANITALTVGTSNILGLPVFLPASALTAGNYLKELYSATAGAAIVTVATAGTTVAGMNNTTGGSTTTSADVRGTYLPVTQIPDGAASWILEVILDDPGYLGAAQA